MHRLLPVLTLASLALGCRSFSGGSTDSQVASAEAAAADTPTTLSGGRWLGWAKLAGERMPAELDLVPVLGRYRGVLKLSRGGFASHEYASTYFADVAYTEAAQTVAFAGGPDDVQVVNARLTARTLKATLTSAKDKSSAELELHFAGDDAVDGDPALGFAALPLANHVTGNYVGNCPGQIVSLQVEASKWRGAHEADAGLFGGYRLTGRVGETDDFTCGKNQTCVKESYASGELNLLTGSVVLKGAKTERTCTLKGDAVTCDACTLTKDPISSHAMLNAQRPFKTVKRTEHLTADQTPDALSGQYYGYLHHEAQGTYQLVALNVRAEAAVDAASGAPKTGQHVGAVATLYFGEGDSSEFIAYRFKEATVGSEGTHQLVLDGDGEAFLVVDEWQGKVIKGTWVSKTFGRVGTVELQRDLVPALASEVATIDHISGHYKSDEWDFELAATAGISEDAADFYPVRIYGWAREKIDNSRRRSIEEGAYDFYTGAFAFRLDDGRTAVGRLTPGGMQIHWPPKPRLGTPIAGTVQVFQRVVEPAKKVSLNK